MVHGVSTCSADDLVQAMGMSGISKSQVGRLCAEIDEKVKADHRCHRDRVCAKLPRPNGRVLSTASPRGACSKRHSSMTISLAFLAPSLVKAAVDGRLPRGIGVARLFDAPVAWSREQQMLGSAH